MNVSRLVLCVAIGCVTASSAPAQVRRMFRGMPAPAPTGPGVVNLPYISPDAQGNQWMVYGPGSVQMQGNSPVFSQAGQLLINNMQPMATSNTGRIDDKTGELLLENMQAGSIAITRRILIKPDASTVRFIDVFTNPTAAAQTVTLRITTNLNFGVQSASLVPDPKRKDQNLAWVAQTGNNQTAFEWVGAAGAKVLPTLNWTQGSPFVQSTLSISIPANGKIALLHVDGAADSAASAQKWISEVKVRSLLADLPADVRQLIVNVPARSTGVSTELDLIRGDVLDVVQLRGGDRIMGSVDAATFTVRSAFGPVKVPADHLLGVISGGSQPLWAMSDGQVLAGAADEPSLQFEIAGGATMQFAWLQVERIGFRRRSGEPADAPDGLPPLPAPAVVLTGGDRLRLAPSADAVDVLTRYGQLHIPADSVGSIAFNDADASVDVITLADGSRFTGLMPARTVTGIAPLLGSDKPISVDVSQIALLQLHDVPDDTGPADARLLSTTTGNTFAGALQHTVSLRTSAGPLALDAAVISSITSADDADRTLKLTTADGTVLTGRLTDDAVSVKTLSGVEVTVPAIEVKSYTNPSAGPSAMSRSGLDPWITLLNADDWKQRDTAEHQLLRLGPAVSATLRQARDKQTPEAQQRIDSILKQLDAAAQAHAVQ